MPDAKTDFTKNLPEKISGDPDGAKEIGAVFMFKITGDGGGTWTVNCRDEVGVHEGEHGEADCTLELSAEDWQSISDNPSMAMQLYFQGKLKVSGDAMKATKLQQLLG
ncbi:MAG: SCP2 sterol-binding domain-containing protein [Sandaracinaceae bacterium]|nr:SCP2 sterol-binding domain-containing protein [Sandaracinaceae bacterium]